jgi:hypothetical protein
MESRITKADVAKAKALVASWERQEKDRKHRKVTKVQASKAVATFGHYAEQQAKKAVKTGTAKAKKLAKAGEKKWKSMFKKK